MPDGERYLDIQAVYAYYDSEGSSGVEIWAASKRIPKAVLDALPAPKGHGAAA